VPDVGLLTLEHFCRVIREVADAARADDGSRLPVMADADTGFGEAEMVRRTVIEYARAGAAGLHLEDQRFPKRCGHLDGKELVPTDHMVEKIEWARKASDDGKSGIVICARTDARGVEGFEGAVKRAKAYVEAGAEMIFPEGLASEEEFGRFAREMGRGGEQSGASQSLSPGVPGNGHGVPWLLANMTEFGKTPIIPLKRFEAMGYSIVIYPVSLLRVAMGAVTRALEVLKAEGSVEKLLGEMQSRKELYGLIGYEPGKPWEFPSGE